MSGDELTVSELGANPSTTDRAPAGPGGRSAPLSVDQILDGLAEGFFALDSNWRFIAFNRAAEAMFEIAREQVLGKLLWEVSPGILGTEFDRRYRLAMSSRQEQQFESYTIRGRIAITRSALFRSAKGSGSHSRTPPIGGISLRRSVVASSSSRAFRRSAASAA